MGGLQTFAAISANGSYAQIVYFAKSRERPFAAVRTGHRRCNAASLKRTFHAILP
jgi:hypothetical protein